MSKRRVSRRTKKVPRSYRAGNLLTLLASDLASHTLERRSVSDGQFRAAKPGLPHFDVSERVIKNFLGHVTVAVFSHRLPPVASGTGRVSLRVTGAWRGTGLEPKAVAGGGDVLATAADLCDDRRFREAALALDFKRFDLVGDDDGWTAEIELMGASQVVTAIPPMRRYIRLYPDQREALFAVLRAMERVLGRSV